MVWRRPDGAISHPPKPGKMGPFESSFPGSLQPESLSAEEFRNSSLFSFFTSHAEGVPKVTQEAAACGLPIILNGYYEAPTVIHQRNGLVAWSDEELAAHVGALIRDPEARKKTSRSRARRWQDNGVGSKDRAALGGAVPIWHGCW